MERSTTALLAAVAVIAVGGLVLALQPPPPPPAPPEAPVAAPPPPIAPTPVARVEAAPVACGLTLPADSKLAALTVRPGDAIATGQVFARLADGREVCAPRAGKVTLLGLKVGEVARAAGDAAARPAVVMTPAAAWVARLPLPSTPEAPAPALHPGDTLALRARAGGEGEVIGVVVEVVVQPGGIEVVLDLPASAKLAAGDALLPTLPAVAAAVDVEPLFAGIVVAAPSLATRRLQPALTAPPTLRPLPRDGFRLDDAATSAPRLGAGPPGNAPAPGGFRLKPATRPLLTPPPRTEPP